ncbi:glycosyltransferase family 2 protein [Kutzneria albida]|uniref:Glycosyltransferase 2-like domain-containing protein n=1 Tax=Kutzneria albida DSM 43870 TaxID=1449976 RepID=W5WC68_9PSEU|nr:glycosyltransferase [Kutzneria albida]AHH98355.1 hypothetical protein KALB_4993 [Kutzneria albida DSM 43870]
MNPSIGLVIPAHPARVRNGMLTRAINSVCVQKLQPSELHVTVDRRREGAAATRNRGLAAVQAKWVAFLDSDDEFLPQHLERLAAHAVETGADMVYPWFEPVGMTDPVGRFGQPFDPVQLRTANYIPVTVLVRTELLRSVGGFRDRFDPAVLATCEDWGAWLALVDAGARIVHLPERTWKWHQHGGRTSGRAVQGDAA